MNNNTSFIIIDVNAACIGSPSIGTPSVDTPHFVLDDDDVKLMDTLTDKTKKISSDKAKPVWMYLSYFKHIFSCFLCGYL